MNDDERPGAVLLVDDAAGSLVLLAAILKSKGIEVRRVETMAGALETVEDGAPLDVVLTAVRLPDGTGPRLVEKIRRVHPGCPAVFISDEAEDEEYFSEGLMEHSMVFRSPLPILEISRTVRELRGRDRDALL